MSTQIVKRQMPEERELEKKRAELAELEERLAERELELATLQAELNAFEQRYLRVVGTRYAELDEIKAQIAEAQACLNPEDNTAQSAASEARKQAKESSGAASDATKSLSKPAFNPSNDLKKLYRELARKMHPDLATDAVERARRHELMIEINRAYEMGDAARLQAIMSDWQHSPASIKDEGFGAELVKVIRQIAQVEERIETILAMIEQLEESELSQLKWKVLEAADEGRDLLVEMAAAVGEEIFNAKAKGYDVLVSFLNYLDNQRSRKRN